MRFGRKKDEAEEADVQGTALSGDTGEGGPPDPSTWALPADAAVTAPEQDTVDIESVAPATAAGGLGREEPAAVPATSQGAPAPSATPEPSTTVGGGSITSPGLGADVPPVAAAAANASDPAPATSPAAAAAPPPPPRDTAALERPSGSGSALAAILEHPTVKKRPEILVAGAFVGAFLAARILKRISE